MRVGVIGVGVAGSSHLFDLVSSGDFTVAAVCANRIDRAKQTADLYGVALAFADPSAMLAEGRLDAVVIATPPRVTPDIAALILAHGLPAVIDKPAGVSATALEQVCRAVRPGPARAVVAYNRRYQSHVHRARAMLARQELGPLCAVECRWVGPFTNRYTDESTHRRHVGWGDGVALDTASHVLDTLAFLGVGRLAVTRASLTAGPTGADVAAHVDLACPGGPPVNLSIDDQDGAEEWKIIVRGWDGELHLTRAGLTGTVKGRSVAEAASDLRRPVDDLLALATGDQTFGATLSEAVTALALIDDIRTIARRRRWHRPRAKALGRLNGAC